MRSLVPPELSSEAFVLFAELLILLLEVCFLLLKFINAIFESSDPLKQLLHFFVSDHHNSPRSVQTTRDGLLPETVPRRTPCRLHCSTVGSGATYESGEIVLGVNTYQFSTPTPLFPMERTYQSLEPITV